MTRFVLRRLLGLAPTLLAIVTVTFILVHAAPGEPFQGEKAISPEALAQLRAHHGLDRPVPEQYFIYLKNVLLHADLGDSIKYQQRSVAELIAASFPATFVVGVAALLWALLVGSIAGIVGAVRQNTAWDYGAMAFALIGISVPSFVLGPLLILVFALSAYWLPPAGWGEPRHVVLPALTLGTIYAAGIARLTRTGLLEVIRQDFVRTARAKGLSEQLVIWRHVLKGGILPVVSWLGPMTAALFSGSVVVETIFNVPGTGPYFVDAARNHDYNLVLGVVIFYSVFLLAANLLVDLAYGWLDPRIRYE